MITINCAHCGAKNKIGNYKSRWKCSKCGGWQDYDPGTEEEQAERATLLKRIKAVNWMTLPLHHVAAVVKCLDNCELGDADGCRAREGEE
jgi:transposase-like protein